MPPLTRREAFFLPDALESVNDHQRSIWVCAKKSLDLLLQPAVQFLRHGGKAQVCWGVVCDVQQAVLDAGIAVFQAEVEDAAPESGEIPDRLSFGNTQAEPQSQPGFSHLRRSSQDMQALGKQFVYDKADGRQDGAYQSFAVQIGQRGWIHVRPSFFSEFVLGQSQLRPSAGFPIRNLCPSPIRTLRSSL